MSNKKQNLARLTKKQAKQDQRRRPHVDKYAPLAPSHAKESRDERS
ncbi:MAG: hypothetical protein KDB63_14060 [Nocardioidaceae bacterium]|nr:hypothetical protein [Nocardioidaceae bacterium]